MKTVSLLSILVLLTGGVAFGQSSVDTPSPGTMLPNPTMETDRPVGEDECYPPGTVDAQGRVPTDKPICDDLQQNRDTPERSRDDAEPVMPPGRAIEPLEREP
jgi:hypothetical protein